MVKDANKPKGRTTAYAFFIQTCREEHKKQYPGKAVDFKEFSQKCAAKWREMKDPEKKRFTHMAQQDKKRYEDEMKNYNPGPNEGKGKRKKKTKDPNAPKRAMSGFFFFSQEERATVKAANPSYTIGDVAKRLGEMWQKADKAKYEAMAKKDRARYEKDMAAYNKTNKGQSPSKKAKLSGKAAKAVVEKSEEEDEEEEEEDEVEEEEDEEEEEDDEEDEEDDE